jgi:two-component system invasion response regulator UvrY
VDDHPLIRLGIRRLLDDVPDIEVSAEAENGDAALMLIKLHQPDIVLLDMKMPGIDGWEVARRLKKTNPKVNIIILSGIAIELFPVHILQLGAMGYLSKESSVDEIILAIRKVAQGERYIDTKIAQEIAINRLHTSEKTPFERLSEREMQVMLMLSKGQTVPSIAKNLFLSTKTVNGYRYRMFDKLGIKNDVELIYLAMKHKMIEQFADATE